MFKKETIVYIMRQISYRRKNPTRRDKLLILLMAFATGCCAVFMFAFLVSGSDIFGWLFDAARAAIIIIFVIGFAWWIYDVIKLMK
jgi:NADH:ubiquinone oxidoreductase subunit B-like Fe-S oxidoreductase